MSSTRCGEYAAGVDGMGNASAAGQQLLSMVPALLEEFGAEAMITPNQDLLLTNIAPEAKEDFATRVDEYAARPTSTLRRLSGACVGLPTCRLSYTDSEQFEPELMTELERAGYGEVAESVGVTGCERQCFRPGTKSIGWVGQGPGMYMLKIGGDAGGRHQGVPLVEDGKLYLRQVPRDLVATVTGALFDHWQHHRQPGEDLGAFVRRVGHLAILNHLRQHPDTADVCVKSAPAAYSPHLVELNVLPSSA
ncbi:MAG: hypothetical protein AAGK78_06445 [Planctomycetota bacterium]